MGLLPIPGARRPTFQGMLFLHAPDNLPVPVAMRVGDSWEANLTLTSATSPLRRTLSASACRRAAGT